MPPGEIGSLRSVEADIGLSQHRAALGVARRLRNVSVAHGKFPSWRSGKTTASSMTDGTGCAIEGSMVNVTRTARKTGIVAGLLLWGARAVGPHFVNGDGRPFSLRLSPWFLEEVVDVPSIRFPGPAQARFRDQRDQAVRANASLYPCGAGDGQSPPSTEWFLGCPIR